MLRKVKEVDLSNNPLSDFQNAIIILSGLPILKSLRISITKQEEALFTLQTLTSLRWLNDKPTQQSNTSNEFDVDDTDVEKISLDNELENFHEFFSIILGKIEQERPEVKTQFSEQFQSLLNKEIEAINGFLDSSVPNFIYATKILMAKLKIYNFFNEAIIKVDRTNSLSTVQIKLIEIKNKTILEMEDINYNLMSKVDHLNVKRSPGTEKDSEIVANLKSMVAKQEEDLNEAEHINNQLKEEIESKATEIELLKDEESSLLNKIGQLEQENKKMTDNLLQNTRALVGNNSTGILKSNTNNNIRVQSNSTNSSIQMKQVRKQSNSKIQKEGAGNVVVSTTGAKILTRKMLLEIIEEIYHSKTNFDRTSIENKMPKETMEQYMYTYLNYKYGLKSLIIEWAVSIINGIKAFSSEDSAVLLFGKILKNEIEEEFRFTFEKLKKTINDLLHVS